MRQYKALPTLAYRNYQAAQAATVGSARRSGSTTCFFDFRVERGGGLKLAWVARHTAHPLRFLTFGGDAKRQRVELLSPENWRFRGVGSGQTYSRKADFTCSRAFRHCPEAHKSNDNALLAYIRKMENTHASTRSVLRLSYKQTDAGERWLLLCGLFWRDLINPEFTRLSVA